MIGFHFQRPTPNWPQIIPHLIEGTWIKAIDNVQMLAEAKRIRPDLHTVLRHWYDPGQVFGPHVDYRAQAFNFLNSFLDETFNQHAEWVTAVEGFNEYNASSHTAAEIEQRVNWVRELIFVFENDFAPRWQNRVRLVVGNVAVGNDVPLETARLTYQAGHILGYHPYIATLNGELATRVPSDGRPVDDWLFISGRFAAMDKHFRANGIYADWLGTECGPVGMNHWGGLMPNDGWRSNNSLRHNLTAYKNVLSYWLTRIGNWNQSHQHRFLGGTLFTVGPPPGPWDSFKHDLAEMLELSKHIKGFGLIGRATGEQVTNPPQPPPIEPPPPIVDIGEVEAIRRVIRSVPNMSLNSNAAIQKQLVRDGLVPVTTEKVVTTTAAKYYAQAGETVSGPYVRRIYAISQKSVDKGAWHEVFWFDDT